MQLAQWLLDKLISWPVAAFAIVMLFRKPLIGLLGREGIKFGVGKEGLTFDTTAAITQQKPKAIAVGLENPEIGKRLQEARNIDIPPIVQEQAELVRKDLKELGVTQEEQVELLVKQLAVTQLRLRSEVTYRSIFGSQIALLKALNISVGAKKEKLAEFYNAAKRKFPAVYDHWSLEQYLGYLHQQALIKAEGQNWYVITVAGREFLKWIADTGLAENKPF